MSTYPPPGPGGVGRRIEEAVELIEMELRHAITYEIGRVGPPDYQVAAGYYLRGYFGR
jgi:hypothetical protein